MSESSTPQEKLPREEPVASADDGSLQEDAKVVEGAERLENEDLIDEALRYEKMRAVKRKTRINEVWTWCIVSFCILLFSLLCGSAVVFFFHHLTPWGWLSDTQVAFVNELGKYVAIGAAFFAVGRKHEIVGDIIERLTEE